MLFRPPSESAGVGGEHEDGMVVRRVGAPPALPGLIGPLAPDRAEHVAAHDGRSNPGVATLEELIVEAFVATLLTQHPASRAGLENPFVQPWPANTERVLEALVGAGTVSVDGDRKVMDAQLAHDLRQQLPPPPPPPPPPEKPPL